METNMLTPERRDALLKLSTPLVVDAMDRLGLPERVLDPAIRPVLPFTKMLGTAVTVLLKPQPDPAKANLALYSQAFESGQEVYCPIMVVEVPKMHHHQGIFGEGAATMGLQNGFVGALIDGAVRDTPDLHRMNFPAFSRTIAPGYICGKVEAVSSGEPVRIGGVTIIAGAILFGDNDGVVVIDPTHLDAVIGKAQAIQRWEHVVHRAISEGCSSEEIQKKAGPMP
ncbi:MAG: hypothetical protein DRP97_07390 [Candidatus Latescibacterota bacterium]|nr:MAG: hypothetical protein DRP97_07390 [Candidatus Latescibacterota bacterium]